MNGHDYPDIYDEDDNDYGDDYEYSSEDASLAEALLQDPVFKRDLEKGKERTRNIDRLYTEFVHELWRGASFAEAWPRLTAGLFEPRDKCARQDENERLLDELLWGME